MTKQLKVVNSVRSSIDGMSLEQIADNIAMMIFHHGKYSTVDLEQDEYDDYYSIRLNVKRLETDEEYKERLETTAAHAARIEAYDRATYERLKKQFND